MATISVKFKYEKEREKFLNQKQKEQDIKDDPTKAPPQRMGSLETRLRPKNSKEKNRVSSIISP